MLNPTISRREFKRSATRALHRLQDNGITISYDQVLDALSAAIGCRDWNTACSALPSLPGVASIGADPTYAPAPQPVLALPMSGAGVYAGQHLQHVAHGHSRIGRAYPGMVAGRPSARFLDDMDVDWAVEDAMLNSGLDVVLACPGGGSSLIAARSSLAWCAHRIASTQGSAQGTKSRDKPVLPRMLSIEIGSLYQAMALTIRSGLSMVESNSVAWARPELGAGERVNPFDTYPGCRTPTPLQSSALVALMLLCVHHLDNKQDGDADTARTLVEEVYAHLADTPAGHPRSYRVGLLPRVDKTLAGLDISPPATWWACADLLAGLGEHRLAQACQGQAVPRMSDITALARSGQSIGEGGVLDGAVLELATRLDRGAGDEPMLAGPTSFARGYRMACIDLSATSAQSRGGSLDVTGLAFLVVRQATIGAIVPDRDAWAMMPDAYRPVQGSTEDVWHHKGGARLVLNDVHRYTHCPAVGQLVLADLQRARVMGVSCMVSGMPCMVDSVSLSTVIGQADSVRVCGNIPSGVHRQRLATLLGLSEGMQALLEGDGLGVDPCGVVRMLATRGSRATQGIHAQGLECVPTTPTMRWALASVAYDAALLQRCYQRLDGVGARRILAQAYPQGTLGAAYEPGGQLHQDRQREISKTSWRDPVEDIYQALPMEAEVAGGYSAEGYPIF